MQTSANAVPAGPPQSFFVAQVQDPGTRSWGQHGSATFEIAQDAYFHILDAGDPARKYRIARCDLQPMMLVENFGDKQR